MTEKRKKITELKEKLKKLEEKDLPEALKKFGESYGEGSEWEVDPSFGIKDDQVAVISAMIDDLKNEIRQLEKEKKEIRKGKHG